MIIYSIYHWFAKTLAFRADFCLTCDTERVALRIRTVDFLAIFWIPVLPLGVWRRWRCVECGNDPHHKVNLWRAVKLAFAILFLFFAAIFWVRPADAPDSALPAADVWVLRAVTVTLSGLLLWWALRPGKRPTLKQKLATVQPLDLTDCPICGHRLDQWRDEALCRGCGARHLPLRRRDSSGPFPRAG